MFLLAFGKAAVGSAGGAAVCSRLGDTAGTSTGWFGHIVGLSPQPLLTAIPSPAHESRMSTSPLWEGGKPMHEGYLKAHS